MTDLKTDYGAGDTLPAADVNEANAKVNQNSSDISGNASAISGKAAVDHTHDLVDLDDIDFTGIAAGKILAKKDGDGFEFVDPPAGGGGSLVNVARYADQVLAANTHTKVLLNSVIFDALNEYDEITNYRFIASAAGVYSVSATVFIASLVADKKVELYIKKNGTTENLSVQYTYSVVTGNMHASLNYLMSLAAGDYIELWVREGDTSNRTLSNSVFRVVQVG